MPRVLIVEDEDTLRSSMVRGLARLAGIEVIDTATVTDAMAVIARVPVDLILSDIDLPDRSGLELIGELKMRHLSTPIVFISAYLASFRSVIPTHACIDVREKPVPLEELRALVQKYTQTHAALGVFAVADYLQLAVQSHRSVTIDVEGGGALLVIDGEPWTAFDPHGDGIDAFQRIALRNAVGCRGVGMPYPQRTLFDRWDTLLFETARLHDEAQRDAVDVAASKTAPAPPANLAPARVEEVFELAWEQGVEALIGRDYDTALVHFLRCEDLVPGDRRVATNLKRLHELGVRPVDDADTTDTSTNGSRS